MNVRISSPGRAMIGTFLTFAIGLFANSLAEDWPRFRGPNGSGVITSPEIPDTFGRDSNRLWMIDSGSGTSSPIVSAGRVYFTSFSGDQRTLHCVNTANGEEIWKQSIDKLRDEAATSPANPATCTPVCEGAHVCVHFPDAGLCCFSTDGQLQWKKDLGPFHSMHGISSSLIVADGRVVVIVDQLQDSFIAAYSLADGSEAWKTDRLIGVTGGYTTPCVHAGSGGTTIVAPGPIELAAYRAATGEKVWWALGLTNAPIGLPVVNGNQLLVCEPPGEPLPISAFGDADRNSDGKIGRDEVESHAGVARLIDRIDQGFGNGDGLVDEAELGKAFGTFVGNGGLACVELGGTGDVTKSHVRWKYNKSMPYIPSIIVVDDIVYSINDGGILTSFGTQSGEVLKRDRLREATGQYYSSPISANGKIYLASVDGKVSIVRAGRAWNVIATNDLEESIHATPAICDGRLYVRTETKLICIRKI